MNKTELFSTKYKVLVVELEDKIDVSKLVEQLNNGVSEVIEVETVNRAISTLGVSNIDYVVITATKVNPAFMDFCERHHVPCSVYTCTAGKKNYIKNGVNQNKIYNDLHRLINHVQKSISKKASQTNMHMSSFLLHV